MEALDFAGPYEVLTTANRVAKGKGLDSPFEVASVATSARVIARAGLVILVDSSLVEAEYAHVAARMSDLVRTMDGFIDEQFYLSPEGERVTIVRFRDAESQRAWARHPDHLDAQQRGRDEFYAWYDISVGAETYARTFVATSTP